MSHENKLSALTEQYNLKDAAISDEAERNFEKALTSERREIARAEKKIRTKYDALKENICNDRDAKSAIANQRYLLEGAHFLLASLNEDREVLNSREAVLGISDNNRETAQRVCKYLSSLEGKAREDAISFLREDKPEEVMKYVQWMLNGGTFSPEVITSYVGAGTNGCYIITPVKLKTEKELEAEFGKWINAVVSQNSSLGHTFTAQPMEIHGFLGYYLQSSSPLVLENCVLTKFADKNIQPRVLNGADIVHNLAKIDSCIINYLNTNTIEGIESEYKSLFPSSIIKNDKKIVGEKIKRAHGLNFQSDDPNKIINEAKTRFLLAGGNCKHYMTYSEVKEILGVGSEVAVSFMLDKGRLIGFKDSATKRVSIEASSVLTFIQDSIPVKNVGWKRKKE